MFVTIATHQKQTNTGGLGHHPDPHPALSVICFSLVISWGGGGKGVFQFEVLRLDKIKLHIFKTLS